MKNSITYLGNEIALSEDQMLAVIKALSAFESDPKAMEQFGKDEDTLACNDLSNAVATIAKELNLTNDTHDKHHKQSRAARGESREGVIQAVRISTWRRPMKRWQVQWWNGDKQRAGTLGAALRLVRLSYPVAAWRKGLDVMQVWEDSEQRRGDTYAKNTVARIVRDAGRIARRGRKRSAAN